MADELKPHDPTGEEKLSSLLVSAGLDPTKAARMAHDVSAPTSPLGVLAAPVSTGVYDTASGLAKTLQNLFYGLSQDSSKPVTEPQGRPQTREEFFAAHRKPHMSLEESQNAAESQARASPEYKAFMEDNRRKAAEDLVAKRKASALQTFQQSKADVPNEESQIEGLWKNELDDRARITQEQQAQPFVERHPALAPAIALGGLTLSGLLTRMGLNKITSRGDELASRVFDATDPVKKAEAAIAARTFEKSADLKKLGVFAGAPLATVEARAFPDQMDYLTMPEGSGAKTGAAARMSDVPSYLLHSIPAYVGGVTSSFVGAKTANPSSKPEVSAATAYLRGMDKNASVHDIARTLAEREASLTPPAISGPSIEGPTPPILLQGSNPPSSLPLAERLAGYREGLPPPVQDLSPESAGASNPNSLGGVLERLRLSPPANTDLKHPAHFQPRAGENNPKNPGQFAKGKPEYPEGDPRRGPEGDEGGK